MTEPINLVRGAELAAVLQTNSWFMRLLAAAAEVNLPDWWIGAGALRHSVWDMLFHGGFDPRAVRDVDLAFFDPSDVSPATDAVVDDRLRDLLPGVRWQATNQTAVHLWYPKRFGVKVEPFGSTIEAIATWPETATAVGASLDRAGRLVLAALCGVDDLLDGVWRWNPRRTTIEHYQERLAQKDPTKRWPSVRVVPAGVDPVSPNR